MTYGEKIRSLVQAFYDVTKQFATSRHYTLSYWWVESEFDLDLNDKKIRDDVWEMSYSDDFCDLIQAMDFDDDKKEVTIMMWESNRKKKYTLENYEEFCKEAFICPPFGEDEPNDWDEWFDKHKIQIVSNNCVMELNYDADAVNEIEFGLREIHEAILGDGTATTGNTVGSEYRPAELKDIIRIAVQSDWDHFGYKLDSFAEFIQDFIKKEWNIEKVMWYYNIIHKDIKTYNNLCKCNFNKVDMSKICDVNSELVKKVIDELICTDKEVLHGITDDNKSSDIVFIMDYALKLSGDLIGWFYGELDEEYLDDLIDNYKRKLFGEEN